MHKDAYYFPHDSNARHDPKILRMRSKYNLQGLGLYWAIIEMMREQEDYRLPIEDGNLDGYALDLHCDLGLLKDFISDCVNTFSLFDSDGEYLWSSSLLRRMEKFDVRSEKARLSAQRRWGNIPSQSEGSANAMPTQSDGNAKRREESILKENNSSTNISTTINNNDKVSLLVKTYEENIGMMTPMILEELKDIAQVYPDGWFEKAVNESVKQNKQNLKYVLAILRRWKVDGVSSSKNKEPEHKSKYKPVN